MSRRPSPQPGALYTILHTTAAADQSLIGQVVCIREWREAIAVPWGKLWGSTVPEDNSEPAREVIGLYCAIRRYLLQCNCDLHPFPHRKTKKCHEGEEK